MKIRSRATTNESEDGGLCRPGFDLTWGQLGVQGSECPIDDDAISGYSSLLFMPWGFSVAAVRGFSCHSEET